jgi:hypothetical protein
MRGLADNPDLDPLKSTFYYKVNIRINGDSVPFNLLFLKKYKGVWRI